MIKPKWSFLREDQKRIARLNSWMKFFVDPWFERQSRQRGGILNSKNKGWLYFSTFKKCLTIILTIEECWVCF